MFVRLTTMMMMMMMSNTFKQRNKFTRLSFYLKNSAVQIWQQRSMYKVK